MKEFKYNIGDEVTTKTNRTRLVVMGRHRYVLNNEIINLYSFHDTSYLVQEKHLKPYPMPLEDIREGRYISMVDGGFARIIHVSEVRKVFNVESMCPKKYQATYNFNGMLIRVNTIEYPYTAASYTQKLFYNKIERTIHPGSVIVPLEFKPIPSTVAGAGHFAGDIAYRTKVKNFPNTAATGNLIVLNTENMMGNTQINVKQLLEDLKKEHKYEIEEEKKRRRKESES